MTSTRVNTNDMHTRSVAVHRFSSPPKPHQLRQNVPANEMEDRLSAEPAYFPKNFQDVESNETSAKKRQKTALALTSPVLEDTTGSKKDHGQMPKPNDADDESEMEGEKRYWKMKAKNECRDTNLTLYFRPDARKVNGKCRPQDRNPAKVHSRSNKLRETNCLLAGISSQVSVTYDFLCIHYPLYSSKWTHRGTVNSALSICVDALPCVIAPAFAFAFERMRFLNNLASKNFMGILAPGCWKRIPIPRIFDKEELEQWHKMEQEKEEERERVQKATHP
ncbi:uncharacterized protein EV420DRAFT_1487447 [Desarmillaria tabescens]|uniref:Uncharacterized protein n=1 Tax=Armillaria tabescens TaxID=1929756 RepID=A0AA39J733_ARMTA|nr:uncharacterized protein EV420DRAFT_1487447 [Desarmillaria tabescens]KAK0436665.1 hypothetical protein EV420DRAFT_1487447 [Desarmillaria tabescens]